MALWFSVTRSKYWAVWSYQGHPRADDGAGCFQDKHGKGYILEEIVKALERWSEASPNPSPSEMKAWAVSVSPLRTRISPKGCSSLRSIAREKQKCCKNGET